MEVHGRRTQRALRLAGLFLVLGGSLIAQAQPPSLKLPGRKLDSKEPWGPFLGRSAHLAIGRQYYVQYPARVVFIDPFTLFDIVDKGKLGNPKRLPEFVRRLRPDITDASAFVLFEIKPDHEAGRQEGREQSERYLSALNAAVDPDKILKGGTDYENSLFIEFENGGALWQLSWRTPEPGVTLYRWSFRRKRPGASWKERVAQKDEELPRDEIERHEEMAEQVLRAAYEGGDWPQGFQGQVFLPVDCL